ncbi:biotin transporter BioY [Mesorhizobium tianshanense]|uniref:Biotin transporter n=1 Tax=Mesorhizobium tianshanense TaxID=39844 RepID=A0A562P1Q1_9HYPH|nr:biotin transporter BioY [Mesorhizobium tianshanense]TWI38375.1 biotin transport system substrate-specific component [Mesorhizobium tianshanense]GLS38650.1 biotin transporter BioY [Mesorhizobium tianshanense]
MFSSTYPVLADQAFSGRTTALRNVFLVIAGSLALWLSAKLQVPFYPVPMTMQTFVVLVIGTAFGWRLGAATIALYLAEGALGLPVFAGTPEKGIGLAYMAGPTGGYLLGYLPAAALCGFLANHGWDRRIVTMALSMLLGTVVIYAFGLSWLGTVVGWDKPILAWGLTPFILGDLLKLALAAAVLPLAWKSVGHLGNSDR